MTTRLGPITFLCAGLSSVACSSAPFSFFTVATPTDLPTLHVPTLARSSPVAPSVPEPYPSARGLQRDPFLTEREDRARRAPPGALIVEIEEPVTPNVPGPVVRRPRNVDGLDKLAANGVEFLSVSEKDGRRVASLKNRIVAEGDTVGDYRVARISDEGIQLRSFDGAETRVLRFKREPATLWEQRK